MKWKMTKWKYSLLNENNYMQLNCEQFLAIIEKRSFWSTLIFESVIELS